jgi:hypothetical protein
VGFHVYGGGNHNGMIPVTKDVLDEREKILKSLPQRAPNRAIKPPVAEKLVTIDTVKSESDQKVVVSVAPTETPASLMERVVKTVSRALPSVKMTSGGEIAEVKSVKTPDLEAMISDAVAKALVANSIKPSEFVAVKKRRTRQKKVKVAAVVAQPEASQKFPCYYFQHGKCDKKVCPREHRIVKDELCPHEENGCVHSLCAFKHIKERIFAPRDRIVKQGPAPPKNLTPAVCPTICRDILPGSGLTYVAK